MKRRIDEAWRKFERLVLPATAGPIQRTETRKAFFAGAGVLFEIMTKGVSDGPDVEDVDMAFMKELDAELREFGQQLDADVLPKLARGDA